MIDADRAEIQRVILNFVLVTDLRRETRNWPLEWFDYALERVYNHGSYQQVAMHGPQLPDGLATLREERRQELQRKDEAAVLTEQNTSFRTEIAELKSHLSAANQQSQKRAEEDTRRANAQFNKSIRLSIWTTVLGAVIGGALTLFLAK